MNIKLRRIGPTFTDMDVIGDTIQGRDQQKVQFKIHYRQGWIEGGRVVPPPSWTRFKKKTFHPPPEKS